MVREATQDPSVRELRETGRALEDKGVFEVDMSSGSVEWLNDRALEVIGCSAEQVAAMSVFDMSPERFHERIREDLADEASGKSRRFCILPTRTADGLISWWYVYKTETRATRRWSFAEHIQNTPQSGAEFAFMSMQMDTVFMQATIEGRMDDLEDWVKAQVVRVDADASAVRERVDALRDSLYRVEDKAREAASEATAAKNAALATQREMTRYATGDELREQFDRFGQAEEERATMMGEILRLIKTDALVEERIRAYEGHVKKTTETAVKAIEAQASKSGKGLSRKVTIPVASITALAAVIQYFLQHWGSKLFH